MKKILQVLATIIYSVIASYLLWLLFYWGTPHIMSIGWFLYLIYIFVFSGVLTFIIASISGWLMIPMFYIMGNNRVAQIINLFPFLLHGIDAVQLPWRFGVDYTFLQYLIGISLTITYAITFGAMILLPFTLINKK